MRVIKLYRFLFYNFTKINQIDIYSLNNTKLQTTFFYQKRNIVDYM